MDGDPTSVAPRLQVAVPEGGRTLPTQRRVNADPASELIEALTVTRFWRSVAVGASDECWPWLGDSNKGYGVFYYQGKVRQAHELALSFSTGEVRLPTLDTCHACDNPPCCNPGHLRFDTRQGNVDDMFDRGRGLVGEKSPMAKLSVEVVRMIRERRALGARQKDLADQYGVSDAYISEIVNGHVWQHAGGPITGRSRRSRRNPTSTRKKAT